jgi:hypothetical protein
VIVIDLGRFGRLEALAPDRRHVAPSRDEVVEVSDLDRERTIRVTDWQRTGVSGYVHERFAFLAGGLGLVEEHVLLVRGADFALCREELALEPVQLLWEQVAFGAHHA